MAVYEVGSSQVDLKLAWSRVGGGLESSRVKWTCGECVERVGGKCDELGRDLLVSEEKAVFVDNPPPVSRLCKMIGGTMRRH